MKITESLFSPIVQGSVILLDVGNFSDNANLEGFETISISFRRNNSEQPITFTGIVTQYSVINDDAEHSSDMNPNEKTRAIRLDFMNKDIFFANRNIQISLGIAIVFYLTQQYIFKQESSEQLKNLEKYQDLHLH
jgi:hypothetical protein